jgi:hypothetical protein
MIICRDILGELYIIMNFNDHTVTWDTDTIPLKDRDTCTLSSVEVLIEVYMSANEPQTHRDEYSRATKILDAEYKPESLDDVIKTCENLHLEEQHQLKILLQKYEHLFDGTLGQFNMEQSQLVSNWWILIVNQFMCVHKLFLDQWNNNCNTERKL